MKKTVKLELRVVKEFEVPVEWSNDDLLRQIEDDLAHRIHRPEFSVRWAGHGKFIEANITPLFLPNAEVRHARANHGEAPSVGPTHE